MNWLDIAVASHSLGTEYAKLLGLIFQIRIEAITMDVLGTDTAVLNKP